MAQGARWRRGPPSAAASSSSSLSLSLSLSVSHAPGGSVVEADHGVRCVDSSSEATALHVAVVAHHCAATQTPGWAGRVGGGQLPQQLHTLAPATPSAGVLVGYTVRYLDQLHIAQMKRSSASVGGGSWACGHDTPASPHTLLRDGGPDVEMCAAACWVRVSLRVGTCGKDTAACVSSMVLVTMGWRRRVYCQKRSSLHKS